MDNLLLQQWLCYITIVISVNIVTRSVLLDEWNQTHTDWIVDDEETLILAADKNITNSDRIREMFETTPAFCGISGAIDNFICRHQKTPSQSIPRFWKRLKLRSLINLISERNIGSEGVFQLMTMGRLRFSIQ